MDIKDRIKLIREKTNLSQADFAKKLGVSSGNINDWESGRSKPTCKALQSFIENLGVSADWIITGSGDMYKSENYIYRDFDSESLTVDEDILMNHYRNMPNSIKKEFQDIAVKLLYGEVSKEKEKKETSYYSPNEEAATTEHAV